MPEQCLVLSPCSTKHLSIPVLMLFCVPMDAGGSLQAQPVTFIFFSTNGFNQQTQSGCLPSLAVSRASLDRA